MQRRTSLEVCDDWQKNTEGVFDNFLLSNNFVLSSYSQPSFPEEKQENSTYITNNAGNNEDSSIERDAPENSVSDASLNSQLKRKRVQDSKGGSNKEQAQHRRNRNREHARKSRLRMKNTIEKLKEAAEELQIQNCRLKQAIAKSESGESDDDNVTSHQDNTSSVSIFDHPGYNFIKALQAQRNFVILDTSEPHNPIIYANQGFLEVAQVKSEDIIGKKSSVLQSINHKIIEYV